MYLKYRFRSKWGFGCEYGSCNTTYEDALADAESEIEYIQRQLAEAGITDVVVEFCEISSSGNPYRITICDSEGDCWDRADVKAALSNEYYLTD